jgi:hypothetical protein
LGQPDDQEDDGADGQPDHLPAPNTQQQHHDSDHGRGVGGMTGREAVLRDRLRQWPHVGPRPADDLLQQRVDRPDDTDAHHEDRGIQPSAQGEYDSQQHAGDRCERCQIGDVVRELGEPFDRRTPGVVDPDQQPLLAGYRPHFDDPDREHRDDAGRQRREAQSGRSAHPRAETIRRRSGARDPRSRTSCRDSPGC